VVTYSAETANLLRKLGPLLVGDALKVKHHLGEAGADLRVPRAQID
jgi:hypothetical protein